MKKLILLGAAFLGLGATFNSANAQVLELPDFNSGKAVWIIRAGANFNSAVGDWKDDVEKSWENAHRISLTDKSFPSSTGFDVSFGFNKSFGNHPLYWGMELGVSTRGYKTSASWAAGKVSQTFGDYIGHKITDEETLTAYNAQLVPFTIGYKYVFLDKMAVDVHLGGFVSYDFAGKLKKYEYDWQTSSGKSHSSEKTQSTDLCDIDEYQCIDAGLNVGVGYWFGHFNIDFSWQRGFINMYDMDSSMYSQSLKLRLGYAF